MRYGPIDGSSSAGSNLGPSWKECSQINGPISAAACAAESHKHGKDDDTDGPATPAKCTGRRRLHRADPMTKFLIHRGHVDVYCAYYGTQLGVRLHRRSDHSISCSSPNGVLRFETHRLGVGKVLLVMRRVHQWCSGRFSKAHPYARTGSGDGLKLSHAREPHRAAR